MSKVKIVYAVEMLHYLPLFIAHERYLINEFDIQLAPDPHGDKAALDMLMSDIGDDNNIDFCVCDPMMVNLPEAYSASYGDRPVVIAQLVQKVPFWAVNHRTGGIESEEHFTKFNQIFAYPEPNTGYYFAKLIHDKCSTLPGSNLSFRPEKAIDADLRHYLAGEGSVVVEADILKIMKYQRETNNQVVFSFPHNPSYKYFCFTALLTRENVLKRDDGLLKAAKLIRALDKSVYLIYQEPCIALDYAITRFSSKGFSSEVIVDSLNILRTQNVLSKSLVVSRRGWDKSLYFHRQVNNNFKYASFRKYVRNQIAHKEFYNRLSEQSDRHSYWLLRNIFDFDPRNTLKFLLIVPFIVSFISPAFFVGWHLLFHYPFNPSILLHHILTAIFWILVIFSKRISILLKIDPSHVYTESFVFLMGYIVLDAKIIYDLLKNHP